MTQSGGQSSSGALASRVLLDKFDQLRHLGISSKVSLTQLVVVGAQSAGKSSVLESVTGFHFPRAVGLCTRHATEIICRREDRKSITISIQPAPGSSEAHEDRARAFRREVKSLDGAEFADIFRDAACVMGIKTDAGDDGLSAFSLDVLRVEISGPDEGHLTIIDVPGIFEHATPGLTSDADIDLVKGMVKDYIRESRTIILAVVPCNADIANQTILRYAAEVDPDGQRTLGVLTKPDLAIEQATKDAVVDLVRGKRRDLQLGYCIVRNRGADDTSSSNEKRDREEREFFKQDPWTKLDQGRLGVSALKTRLQHLLMDRTKSEFPKVRKEIAEQLKIAKEQLEMMGPARSSADEQRAYLGRIAARFRELKDFALDAYYTGNPLFDQKPHLRLITNIRELNEAFSKVFYERGHTRQFVERAEGESSPADRPAIKRDPSDNQSLYPLSFEIPSTGVEDLYNILADPFEWPEQKPDDILDHIADVYHKSRGYELGTFGPGVLPTTFQEQTTKWESLTLAHVSHAIRLVHTFTHDLLAQSCPDPDVRAELWAHLLDDLTTRYARAMSQARFLLSVERHGRPITYNPTFDKTLHETGLARARDKISQHAAGASRTSDEAGPAEPSSFISASLNDVISMLFRLDLGVESTSEKIHDVLKSYYEVARSRFVDVVCQQVVDHFLLSGPESPLRVLSEERVLEMTPEQLEGIAGEAAMSKSNREQLRLDIRALEEARKILMK